MTHGRVMGGGIKCKGIHTLDPYAFLFNSVDVLAHRPGSGSTTDIAAMEEVRRNSIKSKTSV